MTTSRIAIRTETKVLKLVIDTDSGTASGLVESLWYAPLVVGGRLMHRSTNTFVCSDIYRRQPLWRSVNGESELLPKQNEAKSLCRRLRTDLNSLYAEGKINGESISTNEHRQPVA